MTTRVVSDVILWHIGHISIQLNPYSEAACRMIQKILRNRAFLAVADVSVVNSVASLERIGLDVFSDGVMWGKIIMFYALAVHIVKCRPALAYTFIKALTDFSEKFLSLWISERGWEEFLMIYGPRTSILGMAMYAVILAMLLVLMTLS